ncbi:hypothetical protein [Bacillus sp. 165]|uniref:UPF0738 family protein n=1 Tax=Bacillus sp. 165 TaxID=1529117 RepID=UPI001ADBA49E|nr:hypothetical protein [Bacillus sp. 165]MBO9128637.1 hypothetical protein [Bacillus sp. 165]
MQKKIYVKSVHKQDQALILCADQPEFSLQQLRARNHVLVDSDELSFLYILENDDEFVYVSIPHIVWSKVKEAVEADTKILVQADEWQLELENLKEELDYLIHNIEGNSNYGEELVRKVEEIFL